MNNKKILLLSTYPIKKPQHGGQKRTEAIYLAYRRNFKEVRHSAVFSRASYSDYDNDDIALSKKSEALVASSPLTGDIVCGEAIYKDAIVKSKMSQLLKEFNPDVIHVEQPFPFIGLEPLLEELNMFPKIVFGSQNIEAPMKKEILEGVNIPLEIIEKITAQIHELELSFSRKSDLVVACTKKDLAVHIKMGANNTTLASNGVSASMSSPGAKAYWTKKIGAMGVNNTILFVGSAHPPNWTGYLQMVGKGLGFVPYDARIVAVGSISDYFEREIKKDTPNIEDATFWLRAFSTGRISEDRLVALIEIGDVIILPITEGGGSNLKTAEAILANKKVVTTSHALRSFEWFRQFPNVWVADNQKDFQNAIKDALISPLLERSSEQKKQALQVEWKNCLAIMIEKVTEL